MKPWEETWRVGRKVGKTLYRDGEGPDGELVGMLYTREEAALAAAAPDLYRALAMLEWNEKAPLSPCRDCGAAKEFGHYGGCMVGDALKKARGET